MHIHRDDLPVVVSGILNRSVSPLCRPSTCKGRYNGSTSPANSTWACTSSSRSSSSLAISKTSWTRALATTTNLHRRSVLPPRAGKTTTRVCSALSASLTRFVAAIKASKIDLPGSEGSPSPERRPSRPPPIVVRHRTSPSSQQSCSESVIKGLSTSRRSAWTKAGSPYSSAKFCLRMATVAPRGTRTSKVSSSWPIPGRSPG
mmetsp:Transcript_41239/g.89044  ORF Transcript_41239/g.89044 Transcript_41239/m.89044 type:complete len:203 (-) Transcript_41239:127-735(-)